MTRASVTRRNFIGAVAAGAALGQSMRMSEGAELKAAKRPLIVSTWPFGKPANEDALQVFGKGGSALDAVEQGIWNAEADPENSSVGLGGIPNAAGVVQLDACIMNGPDHKGGSVASLEGILHPISVARRVMEKTPHVMLVGAGAKEFALEQGFKEVNLLTEKQRLAWEKWKAEKKSKAGHDTIALLALGADGNLAGGCSTSGLAYKLPGRVGDSPILGSGLYVDNNVGAAGATGVGENVMRFCGSFLVVEFMRQGMHPTEACLAALKRIASLHKGGALQINFIALDKQGRYGAAGSGADFPYAVTYPGYSEVLKGAAMTQASTGPIGGNQPSLKK